MQRYKICQQFTTKAIIAYVRHRLFQTCKDTKFVSNSQHRSLVAIAVQHCFRRAKIQNLSAIHNARILSVSTVSIVSDVQRYKICQQFTTYFLSWSYFIKLFQTCKDTKFVSNSQLYLARRAREVDCFRRAKIQNLSAIHNRLCLRLRLWLCCFNITDLIEIKCCHTNTLFLYM